ncbi:MAG: general secretion pathway protein GspB, partial [Pseudomonadota bacterium]
MSLLLDALRKSENQRRQGELPSLDQPLAAPVTPPPTPYRPKLSSLFFALVGLMVLAAAGWWWVQPSSDSGSVGLTAAQPRAADTASTVASSPEASTVSVPPPSNPLMRAPATIEVNTPTAASAERESPAMAQADPVSASTVVTDATRPTNRDDDSDTNRGDNSSTNRTDPSVVAASDGLASAPIASRPESAAEFEAEAEAEAEAAAQVVDETVATANVAADELDTGSVNTAAAVAKPEQNNYVYPWELPLDARQNFPELDLTVHVYTADPATRFVLINDERFGEGDQVSSGVELLE